MSLREWIARRLSVSRPRLAAGDPWVRLPYAPPLRAFGPGAPADFLVYFAGRSRVEATTPAAIAAWLMTCQYAGDQQLLGEPDAWQHPCAFEVVRSGDCEDYALWAWRKLVEAGYDATFVVGEHHPTNGVAGRHAWVVFRDQSQDHLLDGVYHTPQEIIRPCALATQYVPQVGVTATGRHFVFAGLYQSDWGRTLHVEPHNPA